MAFIESATWSGSGILIDGGYVVTNAHVVWPFEVVRVVFPDGSEFPDAPVLGWDLLVDIAVVGPIEIAIDPVALVDGEDLIIGSDILLIGYPGEVGGFPQPTIGRGLLSRLRQWEAVDLTYFQTDAAAGGGQSGGALVSEDGDVIGISGLLITEARFILAASAADVLTIAEGLIAGKDVAGLGERRVPLTGGQLEHQVTLENEWALRVFVANEPAGTGITVDLEAEHDVGFFLMDVLGNLVLFVDDVLSGGESGSVTTELDAPYFVVPFQFLDEPRNLLVSGDHNLAAYDDPDDGVILSVGQTIVGNIDHPSDFDYFVIDLEADDTVEISIESMMVDPYLFVDFTGATDEQVIFDDDSGGGIFGLNAQVTYKAPHEGSYILVVHDATDANFGGYTLTVSQAPPGAAYVTPIDVAPTVTITSPYGPMALHESAQYPFSIQYPSEWPKSPLASQFGFTAQYARDVLTTFTVSEEDVVDLGLGEMTLDEYTDVILRILMNLAGFALLSRERSTTANGLPVDTIEYSAAPVVPLHAKRLIYLHNSRSAFNAAYTASPDDYEGLAPLIDYSFGTFEVSAGPPPMKLPVPTTTPVSP